MATEQNISSILTLAKACEYYAAVNIGKHNALHGSDINQQWARLIYMERVGIQNRYNLNPSDPTLQGIANYLFSILRYISDAQTRISNLAGSKPVISGPANESTTVGGSATFTVSVTSSTPVVIQWMLNGIPILGAVGNSYSVTNAQLSMSGNLYSAMATNLAGSVQSNQAVLTVTAGLVAFFYQGNVDYSAQLLAGIDNVPYNGNTPITTGQPITITYPNVGATEYTVMKYPATEPTKISYLNPPPSGPDTGSIPSLALDETTFGGWSYVFSRSGAPFGLNSVNGQVKYS